VALKTGCTVVVPEDAFLANLRAVIAGL